MTKKPNPLDRLRHHVTGAIDRGEAQAITEARPYYLVTVTRNGGVLPYHNGVYATLGEALQALQTRPEQESLTPECACVMPEGELRKKAHELVLKGLGLEKAS